MAKVAELGNDAALAVEPLAARVVHLERGGLRLAGRSVYWFPIGTGESGSALG